MRVLVYGYKGWIGSQFTQLLTSRAIQWVPGEERAEHPERIRAELAEKAPTHVISLIGRTHGPGSATIDYLESKGKLKDNVRDNLFAPMCLALACKQRGIHFTYLGTGCIFEYDDEHENAVEGKGFTEGAKPNFFGSSYSTVKGFTDQLMPLLGEGVLNLRIRMPITGEKHPRNFITKIAGYAKICSIPNSMSVLPDLLPAALSLMERKYSGTINLTNPGVISHNEVLTMYKEIVDPEFTWENFTLDEQAEVLAAGRSNNRLDTSLLERLCPGVLPIQEAVRAALGEHAGHAQPCARQAGVPGAMGVFGEWVRTRRLRVGTERGSRMNT